MENPIYAKRHDTTTPSLLFLKASPLEETKRHKTPRAAMAALLSYLSPFPSSSSNSSKNKTKDSKNPRLADATDLMHMLSPQIGCMGQIKTNKPRKGKPKESNMLLRCLVPLFNGSSKVHNVPRSVKLVVNITEMDPPLPVRKKKEEDLYRVSLWERRSGGKELQQLQLRQEHRLRTTIAEMHCFA